MKATPEQGRRRMANDARSGDRVWRERGLREAVLAGDGEAWRTLYDEAFPNLFEYVSWRCGGLSDPAEDLVQQTWLTAVRRIRDFDPVRGSFTQWLSGIASHLLRNHWRKQKHRATESLNGHDPGGPTDEEPHRRERAEAVARALADLPDHYEAVLRAKYLDSLSVNEIAVSRGESVKAIESLLTRARQAFREGYQHREQL